MSFLVTFNGQFQPYVFKVETPSSMRVAGLKALQGLKSEEVGAEFEQILQNTTSRGIQTYQKVQARFEKKKRRIYARDLMSSPLYTIQKSDQASKAKEILIQMNFRHLPVLEGSDTLVGLISWRELVEVNSGKRVEELMQDQVVVAQETTRIQDIAHLMLDEKINALPIVNDNFKLVGIITQSDVLKFVIHMDEFQEWA
jgi:CBS domain-containing protein